MLISEIARLLEGSIVCGSDNSQADIAFGFASDLMSDVLTVKQDDFVLITGLANIQSVRTAEMSNVKCLVVCRGKEITPEMISLARDGDITIIGSPLSMFKCAGILYSAGLPAIF